MATTASRTAVGLIAIGAAAIVFNIAACAIAFVSALVTNNTTVSVFIATLLCTALFSQPKSPEQDAQTQKERADTNPAVECKDSHSHREQPPPPGATDRAANGASSSVQPPRQSGAEEKVKTSHRPRVWEEMALRNTREGSRAYLKARSDRRRAQKPSVDGGNESVASGPLIERQSEDITGSNRTDGPGVLSSRSIIVSPKVAPTGPRSPKGKQKAAGWPSWLRGPAYGEHKGDGVSAATLSTDDNTMLSSAHQKPLEGLNNVKAVAMVMEWLLESRRDVQSAIGILNETSTQSTQILHELLLERLHERLKQAQEKLFIASPDWPAMFNHLDWNTKVIKEADVKTFVEQSTSLEKELRRLGKRRARSNMPTQEIGAMQERARKFRKAVHFQHTDESFEAANKLATAFNHLSTVFSLQFPDNKKALCDHVYSPTSQTQLNSAKEALQEAFVFQTKHPNLWKEMMAGNFGGLTLYMLEETILLGIGRIILYRPGKLGDELHGLCMQLLHSVRYVAPEYVGGG